MKLLRKLGMISIEGTDFDLVQVRLDYNEGSPCSACDFNKEPYPLCKQKSGCWEYDSELATRDFCVLKEKDTWQIED